MPRRREPRGALATEQSRLPIGTADVSPSRTKVRPPPLALIVENHRDTREMYAESLAFNGVRVVAAATADEALEKARSLRPDIIATDLGLPGGPDGVQLCEQLKGDRRTKAIPVVAVTAWAIGEHVERAKAAGCESVLLKPCLPETLLAEIQQLLKLPRWSTARDKR
jgi:two-component system cell cycle response regulator DivK